MHNTDEKIEILKKIYDDEVRFIRRMFDEMKCPFCEKLIEKHQEVVAIDTDLNVTNPHDTSHKKIIGFVHLNCYKSGLCMDDFTKAYLDLVKMKVDDLM